MTSQRYKKYDRGLFYKGSSYKTVTVYNVAIVGHSVVGEFACALQWIPSGQFNSSSKEVCIVHDFVKKKLLHHTSHLDTMQLFSPRNCQLSHAFVSFEVPPEDCRLIALLLSVLL